MKCPGIDSRHLRVALIRCPNCGYRVEIFSDEMKTKCPKCKKSVRRKNLPSCIDWCRYADKCVGKDFSIKTKRKK
jgi:uncharacterized paraquat-inducible protein A